MRIGEALTYNIIFYEKENGKSEVWDFLENLRKKSSSDKDARIQYKQIALYIELLQNNGTSLPNTIIKHIESDIWELRPRRNRILFFCSDKNNFVLLHHFQKKTQKTPRHELKRAKAERNDYLSRKES